MIGWDWIGRPRFDRPCIIKLIVICGLKAGTILVVRPDGLNSFSTAYILFIISTQAEYSIFSIACPSSQLVCVYTGCTLCAYIFVKCCVMYCRSRFATNPFGFGGERAEYRYNYYSIDTSVYCTSTNTHLVNRRIRGTELTHTHI